MRATDSSASVSGRGQPPGQEPSGAAKAPPRSKATGAADGATLNELRDLVLAPERARLDVLQQRIDDPERRLEELAAALPDAVRMRAEDNGFINALQQPVDQCIQHSVERDPQGLADALFPVMGPAIRRAISEALKGIVQSINQAVEHSLSVKGLRWRIEAWRSGTSFAEVVLKNTLLYRVDAAYLIHNETGLLIEHALAETQTSLKDEDAVSAMLTAIQDFIQDSFAGANEGLESVEIGGRTLWVLRGPKATLACVITGVPPRALRERFNASLRDLHLSYRKQLDAFDGDKGPLAGVEPLLQDCLTLEYRESAEEGRSGARWLPWLLIGLMLVVGIGWLVWTQYSWGQRLDAVRARLEQTPGIIVVEWRPARGRRARLLVDPLAESPQQLAADDEVWQWLELQRRPYVSADAPIVLARAARQLEPPATVTLDLDDGMLRLSGAAPADWVQALRGLRVLPPGVDAIDVSALMPKDTGLMAQIRAAIEPPDQVALALDGAKLEVSGVAPWSWIDALAARLAEVDGLSGCDNTELRAAELIRAEDIVATLNQISFAFGDHHRLLPSADEPLDRAASLIGELVGLQQLAPFGLEIDVIGYSDQIGGERWRHWLRERRAEQVIRQLGERGVATDRLDPVPRPGFESPLETPAVADQGRLRVQLTPTAMPACWVG